MRPINNSASEASGLSGEPGGTQAIGVLTGHLVTLLTQQSHTLGKLTATSEVLSSQIENGQQERAMLHRANQSQDTRLNSMQTQVANTAEAARHLEHEMRSAINDLETKLAEKLDAINQRLSWSSKIAENTIPMVLSAIITGVLVWALSPRVTSLDNAPRPSNNTQVKPDAHSAPNGSPPRS